MFDLNGHAHRPPTRTTQFVDVYVVIYERADRAEALRLRREEVEPLRRREQRALESHYERRSLVGVPVSTASVLALRQAGRQPENQVQSPAMMTETPAARSHWSSSGFVSASVMSFVTRSGSSPMVSESLPNFV